MTIKPKFQELNGWTKPAWEGQPRQGYSFDCSALPEVTPEDLWEALHTTRANVLNDIIRLVRDEMMSGRGDVVRHLGGNRENL